MSPRSKRALIGHIQQLMTYWRIRPEELAGQPRRSPPGPDAVAHQNDPTAPPGGVRYRHPVSGETWDGVGSQPQWLKDALLKEGYRPSDLRIGDTPPSAEA